MTALGALALILLVGLLYLYFRIKRKADHDLGNQDKMADAKIANIQAEQDKIIQTKSSSGSTTYQVNLDNLSCTCPDFQKRRKGFELKDPRRLCKHLIAGIDDPFDFFDYNTAQEILSHPNDLGFPLGHRIVTTFSKQIVSASISQDKTKIWIDVFTEGETYGFNVQEQRWSYGNEPRHAEDIVRWLIESWTNIHGEISFELQPFKTSMGKSYEQVGNYCRPSNEEKSGLKSVDKITTRDRQSFQKGRVCVFAVVPGMPIVADISRKKGKWINVFTDLSFYELSYNIATEKWRDTAPPAIVQKAVETWLKDEWKIINSTKKTEFQKIDVARVDTTLAEMMAFFLIRELLAGAIDPIKIQYVDRQTYFVIFVDTVKKWIARLYFQNLGQGKIELPGNKFFNTDQIKDLLHHKEDFISAVKSRIQ